MNARRERFVAAYAKSGCATRAAIEAGYGTKHAKTTGWRLLQNPEVREAVEGLRRKANEEAERSVALSFAEKRKLLKEIALSEDAKTRDRIKAIEVDNAMSGDNAPQKIAAEGFPIPPTIIFEDGDDDSDGR